MADTFLTCDIRGPLSLNSELENVGCKIYLVTLRQINNVAYIRFRNRYASSLSIKVKRCNGMDDTHTHDPAAIMADVNWETSVLNKRLMPSPHFENGSQDLIFVYAEESLVEWRDALAFLLVIRQPSPIWKTFQIQDIFIFGFPRVLSAEKLDLWNVESDSTQDDDEEDEISAKKRTTSRISFRLMNLMERVDSLQQTQTDVTVGNFEVGTSYDINLLL